MKIVFTFMEHDIESSRTISRQGPIFQDMQIWSCGGIGAYMEVFFGFVVDTSKIPKQTKKLYDTHI